MNDVASQDVDGAVVEVVVAGDCATADCRVVDEADAPLARTGETDESRPDRLLVRDYSHEKRRAYPSIRLPRDRADASSDRPHSSPG